MACQMVHSWTFNELVGSFLDLAIAYLLLCASAVAFFTSKFVGLFGLCLPCPCDGFFGTRKKSHCLQRLLADPPCEKISTVQWSVKSKFPFDVIWAENPNLHSNSKFIDEVHHENGHFELEGEASCSSFSETRYLDMVGSESVDENGQNVEFGAVNSEAGKERYLDRREKKTANQRPRLRHRHRAGSVDYGKPSSVSSYDMFHSDGRDTPSSMKMGNDTEVSRDGRETPTEVSSPGSVSRFEVKESADRTKQMEKDGSLVEGSGWHARDKHFDSYGTTAIRVLEQALEEEHAARAALYIELEKERSAAASAADEAMAMILRLQEEKASIEMEAKQYQRMIEEKSAYDAEEMNILKEILARREREKHFMEKELEDYRQMLFGDDQGDFDMHDVVATQAHNTRLYPDEDQVPMLARPNESINEKSNLETTQSYSDHKVPSAEIQNQTLTFGKELPLLGLEEGANSLKQVDMHLHPDIDNHSCTDEVSHDFEEKEVVSMDERPVSQGKEVQTLEVYQQSSQSPSPLGLGSTSICEGLGSKASGIGNQRRASVPYNNDKIDKHGKHHYQGSTDPHSSVSITEPSVLDVHVIDDNSHLCMETCVERSEKIPADASLDICGSNIPTAPELKTQHKIQRVSSDTSSVLLAMGFSRGKPLPSDMRRNSMSSMDYERFKIDSEVERLRERLRIVQEGRREKLNFSVGYRERESIQVELLQDFASQLREIQQLTEPGKAECQAAMLPPLSKVPSKKRQWRNLPLQVCRSS